jgi:hypothetical protein
MLGHLKKTHAWTFFAKKKSSSQSQIAYSLLIGQRRITLAKLKGDDVETLRQMALPESPDYTSVLMEAIETLSIAKDIPIQLCVLPFGDHQNLQAFPFEPDRETLKAQTAEFIDSHYTESKGSLYWQSFVTEKKIWITTINSVFLNSILEGFSKKGLWVNSIQPWIHLFWEAIKLSIPESTTLYLLPHEQGMYASVIHKGTPYWSSLKISPGSEQMTELRSKLLDFLHEYQTQTGSPLPTAAFITCPLECARLGPMLSEGLYMPLQPFVADSKNSFNMWPFVRNAPMPYTDAHLKKKLSWNRRIKTLSGLALIALAITLCAISFDTARLISAKREEVVLKNQLEGMKKANEVLTHAHIQLAKIKDDYKRRLELRESQAKWYALLEIITQTGKNKTQLHKISSDGQTAQIAIEWNFKNPLDSESIHSHLQEIKRVWMLNKSILYVTPLEVISQEEGKFVLQSTVALK